MKKTQLKQIIVDQKLEAQGTDASLFRSEASSFQKLVSTSKLVKVVLGIRRCGKSTLCKIALAGTNYTYINFDDERLIELTAKDFQTVYETAKELNPNVTTFFFDEIQNIESWELFVNRLHRLKYNLIISGSNGKLLGQDLATHLTGRQVSQTLYPISFSEFLIWKQPDLSNTMEYPLSTASKSITRAVFQEYFELGGFPEVVLGEPLQYYLQELFDKIITRDIVQRYKIRESKILKEIALYLIQNSSQSTSLQKLKTVFHLKSLQTTRKYIKLLEDVFLVHELKGYSFKLTERSTSPRKTYACDLGMMRALWSKPTVDLGAKLETLVYLHLLNLKKEIYYLREGNREVDFCLVENGKLMSLIQVCYDISSGETKSREIRALFELGKKYNVQNLRIVTMDTEDSIKFGQQKIEIVPASLFCLKSFT